MSYMVYNADWFVENEARANAALKAAGIWYRHPHVPPKGVTEAVRREPPVVIEPLPVAAEPEPLPEVQLYIARWPLILKAVAHATGVDVKLIVGESQCRPHVTARHVAAWFLVHQLGMSSVRAGRILHRDHSSILHAARVAPNRHQAVIDKVKALLE